jgi:hypothetical protein
MPVGVTSHFLLLFSTQRSETVDMVVSFLYFRQFCLCGQNVVSMRGAELKLELRSRRLHSGGMKPQLQRLLDDDAKAADAHGESSESSEESGNGSDREYLGAQAARTFSRCFWG